MSLTTNNPHHHHHEQHSSTTTTTTVLDQLLRHDNSECDSAIATTPEPSQSLNNSNTMKIKTSNQHKCKIIVSDLVQDQLEALLRQERNYRCVDYIAERQIKDQEAAAAESSSYGPVRIEGMPKPDLVNMLEECASLVTDTRYMETSSLSSSMRSTEVPIVQHFPPSDSLQRVGSLGSFKGVHEETLHTKQQHEEQEQQHSSPSKSHEKQQSQQQKQPSGEDLAYWRQQMFDWACLVVDSFEMDREVVAVAFNLLDRYVPMEMSRGTSRSDDSLQIAMPPITRDDYQLFAMTCLYTAVKISEPYPRKIAVEALVAMSRDFYAAQDICFTERDILKALQWRVNPPTAMAYCRQFETLLASAASSSATTPTKRSGSPISSSSVRAFQDVIMDDVDDDATTVDEEPQDNVNTEMNGLCAKFTELAVSDPWFLSYSNSTIGLAATLHAARLVGRTPTASALLKALQRSKLMSTASTTTTTTTTTTKTPAQNVAGHDDHVDQISPSELEAVYLRLEMLYV